MAEHYTFPSSSAQPASPPLHSPPPSIHNSPRHSINNNAPEELLAHHSPSSSRSASPSTNSYTPLPLSTSDSPAIPSSSPAPGFIPYSPSIQSRLSGTPVPDESVPLSAGVRRGSSLALYPPVVVEEDGGASEYGKNAMRDAPARSRRRWVVILSVLAGVIAVVLLVVLPVYFTVIRKDSAVGKSSADQLNDGSGGSSNPGSAAGPGATGVASNPVIATSGGNGSTVTMDDGSTFVYINKFGGTWDADPTSLKARAQSWTASLGEEWKYGQTRQFGVNLGGWLVTEPFIVPGLYENAYMADGTHPVDEWNLMLALGTNAKNVMDNHYATFITEEDFAQIAGAGLNWIRLPVPYWMVETMPNEPFYTGGCFPYFVKAMNWAKKYGLRINLDLHSASGSQNGWNHSGRVGWINFLNGRDGIFNAERTVEVIRTITEFIMQDEYKDVVKMFSILNEPQGYYMSKEAVVAWNLLVHDVIRAATGYGQGPLIVISDSLLGTAAWSSQDVSGFDRMVLDTHLYIAFGGQTTSDLASYVLFPCTTWSSGMNSSYNTFGFTIGGEFSVAVNDCGKWLNGVAVGNRLEGTYSVDSGNQNNLNWVDNGECDMWANYETWSPSTNANFRNLALTSFDTIQNFFFWTWTIGISSDTNKTINPMWNYKNGLKFGYMPDDPRDSIGACQSLGPGIAPAPSAHPSVIFPPGNVPQSFRSQNPWPPASIGPPSSLINAGLLPTMTKTGVPVTLSSATPTTPPGISTSYEAIGGWANSADTSSAYVQVQGCTTSNLWGDPALKAAPTAACTGA